MMIFRPVHLSTIPRRGRERVDKYYNMLIMYYMIETTQKLIQIGSSEGVTLSKKDLTRLGAKRGDTLKIRVELVNEPESHTKLLREYDKFVEKYGQTLKNLASR